MGQSEIERAASSTVNPLPQYNVVLIKLIAVITLYQYLLIPSQHVLETVRSP